MKMLGIGLLFGGIVLIGGEITSGWKRRLRIIEGLTALVCYIGEQIDSFSAPLEEIYRRFAGQRGELQEFSEELCRSGWEEALAVLPDLPAETARMLAAFGRELGRGSREQELARCRYTAARLEQLAESLRRELPKQSRLCRSLTVTAGMAAAIILW